jgi:hypothetical protein
VTDAVKLPRQVELLNITLEVRDLAEAKRRTGMLAEAFRKEGRRMTDNLNFGYSLALNSCPRYAIDDQHSV